jgi:hypothetical protein
MSAMITDAQLVEQYLKLRAYAVALKEKHDAELKPYAEGMATIENALLERLNERGAKDTKTDAGTAYKSTILTAKVVGRDEILKFCIDNWSTSGSDMLQVGVVKDAVKQHIETTGAPPPGVEISQFTRVNIRRS